MSSESSSGPAKPTRTTPRMTTRERREARRDRRREWGQGRVTKAEAAREAAHNATAALPFGQPILVGHHSEKRHRAALDRGDGQMRKAIEHGDMTRRHEQAASTIDRQLEVSIYDDDPDAIERLRERIEQHEARRLQMKDRNAAYRKAHGAALKELAPYERGRAVPHPSWELSNLGGRISSDRRRLARLEQRV